MQANDAHLVWDDWYPHPRGEDDAGTSCGANNQIGHDIQQRLTTFAAGKSFQGSGYGLNQILQNDEQTGQVEASDDSDVDDGDLVSVHSQIHRVGGSHQAQANDSRPALPIDEVDEFTFVSHKLTGTVHVVKDEQNGRLACGRRRTINMESVDSVNIDASTASFCIQCNAVMKS